MQFNIVNTMYNNNSVHRGNRETADMCIVKGCCMQHKNKDPFSMMEYGDTGYDSIDIASQPVGYIPL